MTEFDDILNQEKQRAYSMGDSNLLAFATLTQIAHEEAQARIRRRFKVSLILIVVVAIAALQLTALSQFNFATFSRSLAQWVQHYPYAITIANLGFIGLILLLRRLRVF